MITFYLWLLVAVPDGMEQRAIQIAQYTSHTACKAGIEFHTGTGLYPNHKLVCVPAQK